MKVELRQKENLNFLRVVAESEEEKQQLKEWYDDYLVDAFSNSLLEIGYKKDEEWQDFDLPEKGTE